MEARNICESTHFAGGSLGEFPSKWDVRTGDGIIPEPISLSAWADSGAFFGLLGPKRSVANVQKKGKEGVCRGHFAVYPLNCRGTSFCIYEPILKTLTLWWRNWRPIRTQGNNRYGAKRGTLAASLRRAAMATPEDPAWCVVLLRAGCLPCPVYYHGIWDPSAQSVGVGAGTFLLRRGTF